MMNFLKPIALCLFFLIGCADTETSNQGKSDYSVNGPTFSKVASTHSKIDFSNDLKADLSSNKNLFDFDYFYNGAGVGIADLNNDGLQDLFFCSNQNQNKLYLNKGDLVFEDISQSSGVTSNQWSTGVTFCDVNRDGWLDIYVCQGGPNKSDNRGNLLYINQKDLTFKEVSSEYGLKDEGLSTQAVFADFDNDGDEDCYVMNEAEVYGFDIRTFFQLINKSEIALHRNSSHYYENVNGKFVDRTKESGLLAPTFGLGLMVSDLNNDNHLDIYQANDYYLPDAIYINNGKGQFSNRIKEMTNQLAFFGMGLDIADINDDGMEDIFVLDMASADHYRAKTLMASMDSEAFDFLVKDLDFPHQYMFNALQLKNKSNKYDNISHMAGVAKTDWSWTALIQDFNQDGEADIYVTNGYRKYALDNDFKTLVETTKTKHNNNVPQQIKEDLYNKMPEEKLSNIFYTKTGGLSFENKAKEQGLAHPSFSNGAAYGDLDSDGDLEIVVNNIDDKAFLYENLSSGHTSQSLIVKPEKKGETFAKVSVHYGDKKKYCEIKRVRGYMSASQPLAHFGFDDSVSEVDSVVVSWRDGTSSKIGKTHLGKTIIVKPNKSDLASIKPKEKSSVLSKRSLGKLGLYYNHKENVYNDFTKEVLLPIKQSTLGPKLSSAKSEGQTSYLFVPASAGNTSTIFKRDGTKFKRIASPSLENDNGQEDIHGVFFDLENDGDLDLLVVSGGNEFLAGSNKYQDRLYINDGNDNFQRENSFVGGSASGGKAQTLDYDKDGFTDVIIANRITPQSYPIPAGSILYKNKGGILTEVTSEIFPGLEDFGIINDIVVTDLNNDGWDDVVIAGEWTGIGVYMNNKGKFSAIDNKLIANSKGWWQSITETDVNSDGLPDLILGNLGLNSKYKATEDKPLKIYAHDFDDTGTIDLVLSNKYKDEYVPLRGRECSSDQMPFIKTKFPSYNLYAKATVDEIYENLDEAYNNSVNEFRSLLLINKGSMNFEITSLPDVAQLAPIMDAETVDLNQDGQLDLITCGNIYDTEAETPRLDYSQATTLISNGESYTTSTEDFNLSANIKSIEKLIIDKKQYLLFGINNGLPQLFEITK